MKSVERESYHHGALRQALVTEAFRLLETEGLEALSLRRLAENTGVSKTAPYRHFEDKNALLTVLAAEGFRLLADALQTASLSAEKGVKAVSELGEAYVQFALERPAMYRLMFSPRGYSLHSAACQANAERAMGSLISAVTEAQKGGWQASKDTRALVMSLWAEAHGWALMINDQLVPPQTGIDIKDWQSFSFSLMKQP